MPGVPNTPEAPMMDPPPAPTITEAVLALSGTEGFDSDGGDFDILREALVATNLAAVLDDRDADFSVFAPTDAAFGQLASDLGFAGDPTDEQAVLEFLLTAIEGVGAGDNDALAVLESILLYHVAPEGRSLAELQQDGAITTAASVDFKIDGTELIDNEPDIANPEVVASNLETANGTIQVIDRVLLPFDVPGGSLPNVTDIITSSDDFDILEVALIGTGLDTVVNAAEDITVFAPTDAAFGQLAVDLGFTGDPGNEGDVLGFLLSALDTLGDPIQLLTDILTYHVSPEAKSLEQINALDEVPTLLGDATFGSEDGELIDNEPNVANPEIVVPNLPGENGIVQVIDRVLLPIDVPGNETGEAIVGTPEADELAGTLGNDAIFGLADRDILFGDNGDDFLSGGFGRDLLSGGDGDDTLLGGGGRDRLDGGNGDDDLTGGRGRDIFVLTDQSGDDTITDLGSFDTILFSASEFADFAELEAAAMSAGDDTVITTANGTVTLEGVAMLEEDVFAFV